MRTVAIPVVSVLMLVAGCGGSEPSDDGAIGGGAAESADDIDNAGETTDAETPAEATGESEATGARGDAGQASEGAGASGDATDVTGEAEPAGKAEPIDPSTLEPGTAVVRVDGNEFRFARGDSIFDVCEFEPDFDLGQAKMDLVDGPEDGSPHLQIGYGADKQIVVLAVPPDIAYIAGKGEETDPYFRHFGVVPPTAGPIEVADGGASGQITMMKVLADELVEASFAVRCS